MTVADYIANQLSDAGVRHVFGIPGGPSIPYMESFRQAGLEFVLVSNEAAAGIMADVTSRLTGIPGVCHATFGPGATNISTGVGGALLDRSAVIVLTSEMSESMLGRTTQMNIDHQKLFSPLTKATFRLSPENAAEVIRKTLRICNEEYPGPVHIGLPAGIAGREIIPSELPESIAAIPESHNDIDTISTLLDGARRPVLAAGLTAKRLGVGRELQNFLSRYRIPVVVTPMAKGLIPEDHPCYAGVLFHALSDYLGELYEKCDLIIGLGYDPVEFNYESWIPDVPLINFDTRNSDLPERDNVHQFTGTPEEWFASLERLHSGSLVFEGAVIRGIRDEMESVFNGFSSHFGPVSALRVLRDEIPANTIVTADVGSHLHLLGQFWKTAPGGELIITNGWSGMGFGIPAAIAASMSRPGKAAVCITGDGGFLMTAGEIATARRYNLPVIVVVFSDGELNLIRLKQSWEGVVPTATTLHSGDLFGSGTFLGVKVLQSDSCESFSDAIRKALLQKEPVIIDAHIDPEDYKYLVVRR